MTPLGTASRDARLQRVDHDPEPFREHWPEYLCEAAELGLFMISAGLFTILLHHPISPVRNFIPSEFIRRMLTGIAMGSTAIALVFSPLGKRSGAHFNPAVTLTFWRLGKVKNWDALFYVVAQFIGGNCRRICSHAVRSRSTLSSNSELRRLLCLACRA